MVTTHEHLVPYIWKEKIKKHLHFLVMKNLDISLQCFHLIFKLYILPFCLPIVQCFLFLLFFNSHKMFLTHQTRQKSEFMIHSQSFLKLYIILLSSPAKIDLEEIILKMLFWWNMCYLISAKALLQKDSQSSDEEKERGR